jgi:hypothetical protein
LFFFCAIISIENEREVKGMKEFFGIKEKYRFEANDIVALITIANVVLIIMGFWWAPMIGLVNCVVGIGLNIKNRVHINLYIMQVAFIVLNIYFLTL